MSDATDMIDMGYGGPDGIDRLIDDAHHCTPRCYYFDAHVKFDNCDECRAWWEDDKPVDTDELFARMNKKIEEIERKHNGH